MWRGLGIIVIVLCSPVSLSNSVLDQQREVPDGTERLAAATTSAIPDNHGFNVLVAANTVVGVASPVLTASALCKVPVKFSCKDESCSLEHS